METMNDADRERFLATLRADESFGAAVRREILTQEVLSLPVAVATLVDTVAEQRRDFAALAGSMATFMEQSISGLRDGFRVTNERFTEIHTDLSGFRSDLSGFRSDLSGFRSDLSGFRSDLSDVRNDLGHAKSAADTGFTTMSARFDQVDAELRDLRANLGEFKGALDDIERRLPPSADDGQE